MRYVATEKGYFDDQIVEPGQEFDADKFNGSWAVPKGDFKPEPEKAEKELAQELVQGARGKRPKKKK